MRVFKAPLTSPSPTSDSPHYSTLMVMGRMTATSLCQPSYTPSYTRNSARGRGRRRLCASPTGTSWKTRYSPTSARASLPCSPSSEKLGFFPGILLTLHLSISHLTHTPPCPTTYTLKSPTPATEAAPLDRHLLPRTRPLTQQVSPPVRLTRLRFAKAPISNFTLLTTVVIRLLAQRISKVNRLLARVDSRFLSRN